MKRTVTILLALVIMLSCVACGDKSSTSTPEIRGVQATTSVTAGETFSALSGVTAYDEGDGDLTSSITLSSEPALTFDADGKATPTTPGNYDIEYSVTNSGGINTKEYSLLTVTQATASEVVFKEYDFSKNFEIKMHGWTLDVNSGAAATMEKKNGRVEIDITNPGDADWNVKFRLPEFNYTPGASYTVQAYMSSNKTPMFHFLGNGQGKYNQELDSTIKVFEIVFDAPATSGTNCAIEMNLGNVKWDGISKQPEGGYKVFIEKVHLYESIGGETETQAFKKTFNSAESINDVVLSTGGDAVAAKTYDAVNSAVQIGVTDFAAGNIWEIAFYVELGVEIKANDKYKLEIDFNNSARQTMEILLEDVDLKHEARAKFWDPDIQNGVRTMTTTFNAESSIDSDKACVRIQAGKPRGSATANNIRISEIRLYKYVGEKETTYTIQRFSAFDEKDPNSEWDVFNGTDESYKGTETGIGSCYAENGSLFYRMAQVGTTDWHNKFYITKITLAPSAYYRFEIKAKANVATEGNFFLNPYKNWDPRLTEAFDLTTEFKTFKFTTTSSFATDMNFELLFQFGGEANQGKGEIIIEFEIIKVIQIPLA